MNETVYTVVYALADNHNFETVLAVTNDLKRASEIIYHLIELREQVLVYEERINETSWGFYINDNNDHFLGYYGIDAYQLNEMPE